MLIKSYGLMMYKAVIQNTGMKVKVVVLTGIFLLVFTAGDAQKYGSSYEKDVPKIKSIDVPDSSNSGRWSRTFRAANGALYMHGMNKSMDNGKTFFKHGDSTVDEFVRRPERATFSKGNLQYAINGFTDVITPGVYSVKAWRSLNGLHNIKEEYDTIYVPGGPLPKKRDEDWDGLYIYRTIVEMKDGSWLMTMYGNFKADTLHPCNRNAQGELVYMQRTILVTSKDQGRSWHYLSSIAAPRAGDPVGEGFVEPAITLLKDGRLLCVMRSGHQFPLYASWSEDGGKTWTAPLYTGLDRGCDPCLVTLKDGRVALSWGRRFPEGWSIISPEGDQGRFSFPGQGYVNLAISDNGGKTWVNHKVIKNAGTCYSTIIEVEPNILYCQSDGWHTRIHLKSLQEK